MEEQKISVHVIQGIQSGECRFEQIRLPVSAITITGLYITSTAVPLGSKGTGVTSEGLIAYIRITVPGKVVYEGELKYTGTIKRTDGFPQLETATVTRLGGGVHQPINIQLSSSDTVLKVQVRCPVGSAAQKVTLYINYTINHDN